MHITCIKDDYVFGGLYLKVCIITEADQTKIFNLQ